ncbi:MAG: prohibitin family protein [Roseibium album]|uniref:Prohibitin n=1 Tax=Effrenium voratum TaxID=2562239 RepID=A0AA36HJZ7_9DINO|nr:MULTISPECIES: prohibitin family protein [Stappiaceae]MBG6143365.1 regulator of protease activity HflC (stomatin/prohibitin superfamily) [Labrenzia sp. EL_142]MBG6158728.1 regulator of protease activity HflC (stomatin/prohibitin superfamily) [Labrenzia sp. EL_162]MBG6160510.1 regulator of protease activity HflC (stomatin/prohibitin superfamily) [Labrenzia sp. EL_195]MBG6175520.1 regulator of protease activity HflC (stomatin/prohibitin superfamily) [Labrenzia sp. EL_132]MBG6197262.1 regulator
MAYEDEYDDYEEELRSDRRRRLQLYLLIMLLACGIGLGVLWNRIVITVQSGEAGVLYRWLSGTELSRIYGEGLHIIWPWNKMNIYNVRLQTKERNYTMLTRDGLPVDLQIAVRYQPDVRLLPLLHVTVGPDYLEKIVFPETEAVLRRSVGQYTPEQVYTSKRGFLETVVIRSLTSVEDRYVIVDDVLVRNVELPAAVRLAIENKLTLSEQEKAYTYRLQIEQKEAERKVIEAEGIKKYQNIVKQSLTEDLLRWQGVQATKDLASSPNSKTVVIGSGKDGLPLILGSDR